jgi:protein phosphatase
MPNFDIEFAAITDIGKIRDKNEDNVLISSDIGLGVVADGMGGHSAGEIASNIAVSVLAETVRKINQHKMQIPPTFLPRLNFTERKLLLAANLANAAIYSTAQTSKLYRMMGTTMTGVLFENNFATAVHVGDSRLYLLRNEKITQITTDHSLVNEHIRRGLLTKEEAAHSNLQNVLTRAMGVKKSVDFDLLKFPVKVGDMMLLCSDGLYKGLDDKEIQQLLNKNKDLPLVKLCKLLVQMSNKNDGQDNITILLVKILPPRKVPFSQRLKHLFSGKK